MVAEKRTIAMIIPFFYYFLLFFRNLYVAPVAINVLPANAISEEKLVISPVFGIWSASLLSFCKLPFSSVFSGVVTGFVVVFTSSQ